jgi:Fic family protein
MAETKAEKNTSYILHRRFTSPAWRDIRGEFPPLFRQEWRDLELKGLMSAFAGEIPSLRAEKHPIEFAALLHIRLVTIHPFVDGNGRAARLLMNLALLQEGYPVTIIPPVLRSEYLAAVKESNAGNVKPFVNLLSSMVWESQRDYLRLLQSLERK